MEEKIEEIQQEIKNIDNKVIGLLEQRESLVQKLQETCSHNIECRYESLYSCGKHSYNVYCVICNKLLFENLTEEEFNIFASNFIKSNGKLFDKDNKF